MARRNDREGLREYMRLYQQTKEYKEKATEKRKLPENKKKQKEGQLRRLYGMTYESYLLLLNRQENSCAVCGSSFMGKQACVDHNHSTGVVRGLLCHNCNRAIGLIGDTVESIRKALNYLENNQNNS